MSKTSKYMSENPGTSFSRKEKKTLAGTLHNIAQGLGVRGGHYGNRLPQKNIYELIILPQPITVTALIAPRIHKA